MRESVLTTPKVVGGLYTFGESVMSTVKRVDGEFQRVRFEYRKACKTLVEGGRGRFEACSG